ncbi:hypothetical protein PVAND_015211 [Polypedilum vanderplanki]|uniref:Lipase domain-containing protein n=1 Tax=Polypedilum vanderplanki TaxID=319348 RepID=A0A9J6BBL5_POLVA|nr:hypothetical protein PVAND_015211 [Polypedilum vanderplanki]
MKNFLSKILYLFIFLHQGQTLVIDGGIYFIFFGSNSSDYVNTTFNYDFASLKNTNYFNMSKPTAIVNHGWIHNIHTSFYVALAEAYLSRGDFNYIAIDWSKYSRDINYADLPPTFNDQAALIVSILIQMQTAGFNLTTFHFIGHSFGAQIFGRVGYQLIQNYHFTPTRITGFDPAGPMFGNFNEWPTSPVALLYPSLNKLNAKFVDIIHTDRYKIGEDYSAGHMDMSFLRQTYWSLINQLQHFFCPIHRLNIQKFSLTYCFFLKFFYLMILDKLVLARGFFFCKEKSNQIFVWVLGYEYRTVFLDSVCIIGF